MNHSETQSYLIESTVACQDNMWVFYLNHPLSKSNQIGTNAYSSTCHHRYCHYFFVCLWCFASNHSGIPQILHTQPIILTCRIFQQFSNRASSRKQIGLWMSCIHGKSSGKQPDNNHWHNKSSAILYLKRKRSSETSNQIWQYGYILEIRNKMLMHTC